MAHMPTTDSSTSFDLVLVGAGIIGLAIAYTWLRENPGGRLLILEKEARCAAHQSGRNSGVLHSGIYYAPGSRRAQNCVRGKAMMEAFCTANQVPFRTVGKLIVARDETELGRLAELERRGLANGVELERCNTARMAELEPEVRGVAGLFLPRTGVVDFGAVCLALQKAIEGAGGELSFGSKVQRIHAETNSVRFEIEGGDTPITARRAIACAGLQADRVARCAGLRAGELNLRIVPFRGEYQRLGEEAARRVRGLIYPVPDPRFPFLGVHFTRRICGRVDCGPNAVPALGRECYERWSTSPRDLATSVSWPGTWRLFARHAPMAFGEAWRSLSAAAFAREAARLLPGLTQQDFSTAPAGIRAQAVDRKGRLLDDYVTRHQGALLHVLNAPSPAATSSLAIGRYLVRLIKDN